MRFDLIWRGTVYPIAADTLETAVWRSDGMFRHCRSGTLWLLQDGSPILMRDLGAVGRGMWAKAARAMPAYPRYRVGDKIYRRYSYAFRKANGDKSLIEIID